MSNADQTREREAEMRAFDEWFTRHTAAPTTSYYDGAKSGFLAAARLGREEVERLKKRHTTCVARSSEIVAEADRLRADLERVTRERDDAVRPLPMDAVALHEHFNAHIRRFNATEEDPLLYSYEVGANYGRHSQARDIAALLPDGFKVDESHDLAARVRELAEAHAAEKAEAIGYRATMKSGARQYAEVRSALGLDSAASHQDVLLRAALTRPQAPAPRVPELETAAQERDTGESWGPVLRSMKASERIGDMRAALDRLKSLGEAFVEGFREEFNRATPAPHAAARERVVEAAMANHRDDVRLGIYVGQIVNDPYAALHNACSALAALAALDQPKGETALERAEAILESPYRTCATSVTLTVEQYENTRRLIAQARTEQERK